MGGLRVKLFGPTAITASGQPVTLQPLASAVLIRLIVAEGTPVSVYELYRDCWPHAVRAGDSYRSEHQKRVDRMQVQKRVLQIRQAIDPDWPGKSGGKSLVSTGTGRVTVYGLSVGREAVDVFQFIDLVSQARRASPETAVGLLESAAGLWDGPPLLDVADKPWAADLIRQLNGLRRTALHELAHAYRLVGRTHDALDTAEGLAARFPGDAGVAAEVEALRRQVRAAQGKRAHREEFAGLRTAVVVQTGDLFAQHGANLVVGFSDTFDTDTDRNIVISAESAQGRLLDILYGGDRARLDKELRAALARVPRVALESRSAKPRGRLARYPVGTVATLHHASRRVFAVAYSRMGNDLMARSSLPMLKASLENLWDSVYRYGQLKPVAMPLIGTGLSRTGASHEELLAMIVASFTASARGRYLAPELRVLVPQQVFDAINIPAAFKSAADDSPDAAAHETPEDEREEG